MIINGSSGTSEAGTTSSITTNLDTLHQAVGNTVTISDGIPADLSPYSQVWDIRFSNNFALSVSDRALYGGFLGAGGGMFVMGENSGFMDRNNSILSLISEVGGGNLNFALPNSSQDVISPFTGPNPVTQVNYAAPGGVDGNGSGDWITKVNGLEQGTGVAWGVGDLSNAQLGALTVIFDVNFMQLNAGTDQENLTKNLIGFVQGEVEPPPPPVNRVPDSGHTLALLGLSVFALLTARRMK